MFLFTRYRDKKTVLFKSDYSLLTIKISKQIFTSCTKNITNISQSIKNIKNIFFSNNNISKYIKNVIYK